MAACERVLPDADQQQADDQDTPARSGLQHQPTLLLTTQPGGDANTPGVSGLDCSALLLALFALGGFLTSHRFQLGYQDLKSRYGSCQHGGCNQTQVPEVFTRPPLPLPLPLVSPPRKRVATLPHHTPRYQSSVLRLVSLRNWPSRMASRFSVRSCLSSFSSSISASRSCTS